MGRQVTAQQLGSLRSKWRFNFHYVQQDLRLDLVNSKTKLLPNVELAWALGFNLFPIQFQQQVVPGQELQHNSIELLP